MQESIQLVIDSLPFLLKGAGYTLQLSIGGMFFGLLLGFILALMRLSPIWPVRWLARFYISIFRGTPLIAQLFMIYYGLPQFGIELDPIPSAMIGLSLNTAAYAAETLRAAISSIDKGQWEAAASIGMTPWQTMRRAILPQAARVALPPLSNSFISLLMITKGQKVNEISEQLNLSPKTVNSYRYRMFSKLNIHGDVELTHLAIRHGLCNAETLSSQ
ncbi:cystine ABC transporter permease [Escherichia coli]|uniref:cystine ABC transporter permease n=1 Tax=Escherichia coli TaxID=562 RepID=UPI00122E5B77|nr:cystine ABC transporter permease [Escherichia coli]